MATNPGVIILTKEQLRGTFMHHRLDIEDNIGEEMHIHYKNFRFDFTVRDFLELAKGMDEALENLMEFKNTGTDEMDITLSGVGKVNIVGTEITKVQSKNDKNLMDNKEIKDYQIWKDMDRGMNFFIIPRHEPWIDDRIINDNNIINKIINYTQKDNKIVEVYDLNFEKIVTKYYENWYPFLIKSSNNWWDKETFQIRQNAYRNRFTTEEIKRKFYNSVIDEYTKFTQNTNCYFSDVFPNNILVNEDYTDFRIIDIGCLKHGNEVKKPTYSQVITGDSANNLNFI